MTEFRLWVHRQIARLDGARERRSVALAAAVIFASLAFGPQAFQAVVAQVNMPRVDAEVVGTTPYVNPVRFRATVTNYLPEQVQFLVAFPDGSSAVVPGHRLSANDPTRWESDPFNGPIDQALTLKAHAIPQDPRENPVDSTAVTFTITDPNAGTGTATGGTGTATTTEEAGSGGTTGGTTGGAAAKTAQLLQAVPVAGIEPKIGAKGITSGFVATAASFRIQSITGLAFLGEYAAQMGTDGSWNLLRAIPGGATYRVTFIARDGATPYESAPLEATVPPAEPAPAPAPTTDPNQTPTQPAAPPSVSMLQPDDGRELFSPVPFAARVSNATATALRFQVIDPAGVTRFAEASPSATGEWTAMFTGGAGQYIVSARAALQDGTQLPSATSRSFKILPSTTTAEPAPTAEPVPAPAPPPPTQPGAAVVEVFAPPLDVPPFLAAVPLSARVLNAQPDKVVAVIRNAAGNETFVITSRTATGDFWTGVFEGPDGEYQVRYRASVSGVDVFSPERRFSVKRAAATATPPPTDTSTALPPPPPPPTDTTNALPPPPTGTTTALPPPPLPTGTPTSTSPTAPATVQPAIHLPEAMATECRAAGIVPERCAEWIKAKYQSRECLDAGAVTREACAELLQRLNVAVDETKLIGLIPRQEILQAREDAMKLGAVPVRRDALPPSIAAFLPPAEDPAAFVRVVGVANATEDSAPALLVLDGDGDGLPDDAERRFGTDPSKADTDEDGFSDGMEVRNGYNPRGPGVLERPLRGVEKALLEGRALEEPRGAETLVDPAFTIASRAEGTTETGTDDVIRLGGTAAPNTVVTIFIYSYLPVVVTTTTDENGNWSYDFSSKLAEGRHEAYVSVNDDTGKLVAASEPLAFFVREAQAVSEEDFLRPDVNVDEAPTTFSRWFIYGGIGLVALALILVVAIIRQVRKSPLPPEAV